MPRAASASSASAISASAAAATQPATTSDQFCVCSPEKMTSPSDGWPTVVDSVAAPIVHTAAVRTPAITVGSASGASTSHSFCHGVMPMPSAASATSGSMPCSATTVLRMTGSSA